ncbi:MAG: BREX-3 system P-loop-containing protein BrxF [Anaerolineae bacterium]|nr:BREX-3 system P-loop-containing protein BrxF [Anaerolineae bacterium]
MDSTDALALSLAQQRIMAQIRSHTALLVLVGMTDLVPQLLQNTALPDDSVYINVGLELAKHLRQNLPTGSLRAAQIMEELLESSGAKSLILDRLEILFALTLHLDVLRLLLDLNRRIPIAAIWPGEYRDARLTYAMPGHPEYREYEYPEAIFPITILAPRR